MVDCHYVKVPVKGYTRQFTSSENACQHTVTNVRLNTLLRLLRCPGVPVYSPTIIGQPTHKWINTALSQLLLSIKMVYDPSEILFFCLLLLNAVDDQQHVQWVASSPDDLN